MNKTFWLQRARREAWRFNFGWWLQKFLPWVIGLGLVGSVGVLLLRSTEQKPEWAGWAVLIAGLVGVVVSLISARKKFLTTTEALVRLDADLHLRNRLTAAESGIGEWPQPKPEAALALAWNWKSLWWPPLTALALTIAAVLVPLPEGHAKAISAKATPPTWTTTQEKLDELRKDEVVQEEAVEEFQKALDALKKQPSDQWFRHESLEASDNLQTQLDQSLGALQKNLETALGALEASRSLEGSQLQALSQPMNEALQKALQGMEMGKLPLDEKMLAQLKNLDVSKMRQLSAEECKKLGDKLKACIGTCSNGFCKGDKAGEAMLALLAVPGNGGVSRGPGAAPLSLKEYETQLGTKNTETVSNDDLSNAAIGDLMGLGSGQHEVDKNNWTGPQAGGTISSAGSGGEAVWEQSATPREQEALRRFFQ